MFSDTLFFRLIQINFFRMDIILFYVNSSVRPHLIIRLCNATLSSAFLRLSFRHVLSFSWQNSKSLLYLLIIASTSFLESCFTLDILCFMVLLRTIQGKHSKTIELLQAFHSKTSLWKWKKPLSCTHECWASIMCSGFGKHLWAKCVFLLSLSSSLFSLFINESLLSHKNSIIFFKNTFCSFLLIHWSDPLLFQWYIFVGNHSLSKVEGQQPFF